MIPQNHPLDSLKTLKNYAASISDYDSALKLSPPLASSFYGRGLAKRGRGDEAGAKADIAAARQIDPQISEEFENYLLPP